MIHLGNSLEVLKTLESDSVDSCVTDPPYELGFMGKSWDSTGIAYNVALWQEVYRVLKPGAHLLAFGGTRTYHRMACAIEDAGFEIRDQMQWLYGSGFPKSHDISKAIDKQAGAEREVIGERQKLESFEYRGNNVYVTGGDKGKVTIDITAPATPAAIQWQGWGTALKPANEPICVARKPFNCTVAENVLQWGTGAINVDAGRIETNNSHSDKNETKRTEPVSMGDLGRWPANVLLDEEAAKMLDEQAPETSRFFYVAKASKSEREAGLGELNKQFLATMGDGIGGREHNESQPTAYRANHHPTVKPIKLMEYLVKLVTPPNGIVLDQFMGSGTTGAACGRLGFEFVGIELDPKYYDIAKARFEHMSCENLFGEI